ncbi:hypothetical protein ACVW0I_002291 [Bradyrhizobium sp. LM6.11]
MPVVGGIIGDPVRLRHEIGTGRDDQRGRRLSLLDFGQQIRIERYLKDRAALSLSRELGVDDFVRPGAEAARRFDSREDVRATVPAPCLQRALDDDRVSPGHGGAGGGERIGVDADAFHDRRGSTVGLEALDEFTFVQRTSLGQHFEHRIPDLGLCPTRRRRP